MSVYAVITHVLFCVETWCRDYTRTEQKSVNDVAKHPIGADNYRKECVLTGIEILHYIVSSQSDCRLFVCLVTSMSIRCNHLVVFDATGDIARASFLGS